MPGCECTIRDPGVHVVTRNAIFILSSSQDPWGGAQMLPEKRKACPRLECEVTHCNAGTTGVQ